MTTRTDECYRLLKDRILDGVYGPGHRLVIDQLGRELKISSIPLREAMRRLEAEGWLEIVPNVGARVAQFDADAWAQTMGLLARLEGLATALAAPVMAESDLAAARRLNQQMGRALTDFDPLQFTRLNRQFHITICRRADDTHLNLLLEMEWARLDLIRRAVFTHAPGRAVESVAEHESLLDLITAGAPSDVVEAAARQHKLNTMSAVVSHDEAVGNATSATRG